MIPRAVLSVCMRCRPAGWEGDDARRPGQALAEAIATTLASARFREPIAFRTIRCMSQCKRPCVVAFSGEDRFTYLFGDLDPKRDAGAVVKAFRLYVSRPEGFMERAERPRALQAGILGRVPPLGTASGLTVSAIRLAPPAHPQADPPPSPDLHAGSPRPT